MIFAGSRNNERGAGHLAMAGALGVIASWASLLWVVFAPTPIPLEGFAQTAVARHHLVTVAQSALLTSLALLLAGGLARVAKLLRPAAMTATPLGDAADLIAGAAGEAKEGKAKAAAADPLDILAGRKCRLLRDGSVEIDTLLGTRHFASVEEAKLFVGARRERQAA